MSYAIGYVIYGVPFDPDSHKNFLYNLAKKDHNFAKKYDLSDIDSMGFETVYSGSLPYTPGWVGISIDTIDECNDVDLFKLIKKIDEQKDSFNKKYKECLNKVPEQIKPMLGKPGLFIVWGSS